MDEHNQMIVDCQNRESKLTEWEIKFIDSLENQIAQRSLSEKQAVALEKIWDRVTS